MAEKEKALVPRVVAEQTAVQYGLSLFEKLFVSVDDQQQAPTVNPEALQEILNGAMEKRDELAAFILRWEREVETIKEIEVKPATNKARSITNLCNGLRDALAQQMESWHDDKGEPAILKKVVGRIHMLILKSAAAKLVIDDDKLVPEEFIEYKPTIKTAELKAALLAGREIEGCRIVTGDYYVEVR